jgi:hypothetical protein
MAQGSGKGAVGPLLLLLLLFAGAGAWNYQRNLALEKAEDRPFRGHSDADLAALIEAYGAQHEKGMDRWQAASGRRVDAQGKDYFQDQVNEFERVSRAHQRTNALRDELAATQATLKLLREEKQRRAQESDALKLFLKRVLTI